MNPRELLQHVDACRPGGEAHDAELASLAEVLPRDGFARDLLQRVHAADARIDAAIRQAAHAIPDGLEARLLAAVRQRAAEDSLRDAAVVTAVRTAVSAPAAGSGGVSPAASPARFSWRRTLVGASLVAAVAALAVYVMNLPRPITADEVVAEVRQVYDREFAVATSWISDRPPGKDFTLPFDALRAGDKFKVGVVPWREFTFDGSDAVVYDLFRGASPLQLAELNRRKANGELVIDKAALFVIERRVYGLPTAPPEVPQGRTDGPCIGVWRSEDMIYALAVEGGVNVEDRMLLYQRLIRPGGLARRFSEPGR